MRSQTLQRTPLRPPQRTQSGQELKVNKNRFGSLEAEIINVHLSPTASFKGGDLLCVELEYFTSQPIEAPIFCISISREEGQICLDINTQTMGISTPVIEGKGRLRFYCDRLDLGGGQYFVDVGIFEKNWEYAYDYHWHVYPLEILAPTSGKGNLMPQCAGRLLSRFLEQRFNLKDEKLAEP